MSTWLGQKLADFREGFSPYSAFRRVFSTFGVPEEISTDGGPEFAAQEFKDFLVRWGVHHRMSSAYFAQSNGRAEVAVKTMKRLVEVASPSPS